MSNEGITAGDIRSEANLRQRLSDAIGPGRHRRLGAPYSISTEAMDRLVEQIEVEVAQMRTVTEGYRQTAAQQVAVAHQQNKELRYSRKQANRERGKQGETIHLLRLELSNAVKQAKEATKLRFELADYKAALADCNAELTKANALLSAELTKNAPLSADLATVRALNENQENALKTMRDIARGREQVITNLKEQVKALGREVTGIATDTDLKALVVELKTRVEKDARTIAIQRETADRNTGLAIREHKEADLNRRTITNLNSRLDVLNHRLEDLEKDLAAERRLSTSQADMIHRVDRLHKKSESGQEACAHDGQKWPCTTRVMMFMTAHGPGSDAWGKFPASNANQPAESNGRNKEDASLNEVLRQLNLTLVRMNEITEETLT